MQPQAQQNQPTPAQVFEEASRLLRMGDLYEAARRAGKLRAYFPEDIPVLTLHGIILAKMGIHPQALSDLIKAATMTEQALQNDQEENPNRPRIVDQLIRLSVQICHSSTTIGEYKAAEEVVENALKWDPDRGDAVAAKAELMATQGDSDTALQLIAKAQDDVLESMPLVMSKARIMLNAEAKDDALSAVADELRKETEVSGLGAHDLGIMLRLIGMIEDKLGNHDESFNSFRRAAKLRRAQYDPRAYTMMTTKVIHDWTADAFAKLTRPDEGTGELGVLMLGAPVSGCHELGMMLGQIEGVQTVGPLETLSTVCQLNLNARQGVLRPVPFEPTKLRGGQLKEAQNAYIAQLKGIGGAETLRAVDTHPLNIPLAGAAAACMPGMHVVLCRRDPMESTLACFCDEMPGNHPYASDLINAAGFVADSNRMLDHWKEVFSDERLGVHVHEVQYNDLVKDPKKVAAKLAREMGIDARATAIKNVPSFADGPATHVSDYETHTRVIDGLFPVTNAS